MHAALTRYVYLMQHKSCSWLRLDVVEMGTFVFLELTEGWNVELSTLNFVIILCH